MGSLVLLLLLFVILLNLPVVQTFFAQKATNYLSEKTGYELSIDKIAISWFDELEAENVHAVDKHGNQLFDVKLLHVDYDLITLIETGEVELDFVSLYEPEFTAVWCNEGHLISLSQFVKDVRETFIKPKKNKVPKIKPLYITGGKIVNGTFHYIDQRTKQSDRENYFDYNYFSFDSIYADVNDFMVHIDTVSFTGKDIVANHTGSHLKVNDLDTRFLYCNQQMELKKLYAEIGESVIKDSLSFEYSTLSAFSHFNDSVRIVANLNESIITSKDLQVFAPQIEIFNDTWTISGGFNGFVSDFGIEDLDINFGGRSSLKGDLDFVGLPNVKETLMDLNFVRSKVYPKDLKQYIRHEGFYNKGITKFGATNFDGTFRGFINNFVAHGDFRTALGLVSTDVNFVINQENSAKTSYSGELNTKDFDIGQFLGVNEIGRTDLNVVIKPGSYGFPLKKSKVTMLGKISALEYRNYRYKNIELDADIALNEFVGALRINDPNLSLNTSNALFDLNKGELDIQGEVTKVNLKQLGFTKDTAFVNGVIKIDVKGFDSENFDIDDLIGHATVNEGKAYFSGNEYDISNFQFDSQIDSSQFRTFDIKSSFADISIDGDFKFKTIVKDFPVLVKEYVLFFENDLDKTQEYYARKDTSVHDYYVNMDAKLKDVSGLLELLDTNIRISDDTELLAELNRGYTSVFNFKAAPDYFKYKQYEFFDNEIDINTSKLVDTSLALGSIYVKSKRQKVNDTEYLEDSDLLINIGGDNVSFAMKTNQIASSNYVFLNGTADFYRDSLNLNLDHSYLHLLNKNWDINSENQITISPKSINFHEVNFNNRNQLLALEGVLSKNKEDKLKIKLRDFDSRNLESLTSVDLGGLISGDLEIYDAYGKPELKSKLLIENFAVLGDTIGKIRGELDWSSEKEKSFIDIDLIRDNLVITHAKGTYDANDAVSPLDVSLKLNDADFSILETFLLGYVKDIKGLANGEIKLTGTIDEPDWNGKIALKDAGFLLDYFKVYFEFTDEILFDKEQIYVKNIALIDTLWRTKAILNGGISHHWFKNFSASTNLGLNNTFILNTQAKDNTLYYGSVFASGDISIDGPFSNLVIGSDELKSTQGTHVYVPLEEPDNLTRKDYITFVTKEDKINLKSSADDAFVSTSGIEMDINFNLTPDALFEIIFDANAGDIIKGSGKGLLNMKIDTRGDFNMFGDYRFKEGSYNFTLIDLINKKFDIKKGSKISWDGDPYQGELSIEALYQQYASLQNVIIDSTLRASTDAKTKVPVDISLGLTGKLLNPDVNFDIKVKDYAASLEAVVADLETKMSTDDQLKNKQVFSLIVLRQFSSEQNIGNISTGTQQNLSELFSNQFSSWVSQFDENLDVAIDFSGYDPESNNIFRLKLSYSLLDGRLRVTRDGNFSNYESSNDLANVFGEWTIEYLITEDGKIRMKAFNKNSSNTIANSEATTNTVYGVSIQHSKSFDGLKDLFKKNKNTSQTQ